MVCLPSDRSPRARVPKSLEQIEETLQRDPEKPFSSGRCLSEIKAVLVQVQKIKRMWKSNLEREADFHHFYIEGDILLSDPSRLVWGGGCACFSQSLHRLIAAYVAASSDSKKLCSVC